MVHRSSRSKGYEKKNKFNSVRQTYDGYSYHSKAEAKYAKELDLRKKAKKTDPNSIKDWGRQFKIELRIKGILICTYKIDFVIYHYDGSRQFVS